MGAPYRIAVLVPNFLAVTRAALAGIGDFTRERSPWIVVNNPWEELIGRRQSAPRTPFDGLIACRPDALRSRHRTVPTVLFTEEFDRGPEPAVVPDSAAIGRLAAEHLMACGFEDLAYIGYHGAEFSIRRGAGFVRAVRRSGRRLHFYGHPEQMVRPWSRLRGAVTVRRWLAHLPKPIGLMACNDYLAMVVIGFCHDLGLSVPGDVAVVGVDNDELACDFCSPGLSSVDVNARQIGYRAAELLLTMLGGRRPPRRPIRVPPAGVVKRQSSDVLAIGDPLTAAAIKFLRDHACEGINVADVVAARRLPRRTLEKACRRLLGRSPLAEIHRVQLARARQMLAETDMPVHQVARLAGFRETKRLSAAFRRCLDTTPSAFRRTAQDRASRRKATGG